MLERDITESRDKMRLIHYDRAEAPLHDGPSATSAGAVTATAFAVCGSAKLIPAIWAIRAAGHRPYPNISVTTRSAAGHTSQQ
jgi:hypothetical protein